MFDFAEKVLSAEKGKTHIFSVGQAGFIIKSAGGQILGIDLYLSQCVERVEGHDGYKRIFPQILSDDELDFDCIIATHFHRDHFDIDAMKGLTSNEKVKLFAAKDCIEDVKTLKIDENKVYFVSPGEEYICGDFKINFINCDHGTGAPLAVGVIINVDGKTVLETGDTCLRLDRKAEYLSQGKIDVLIAPINGAYGNLNEEDCVKLSCEIDPEITIPCHYGMFASHGGDPGKFRDLMNEINRKYLIMTMGEKFTLPEKYMKV